MCRKKLPIEGTWKVDHRPSCSPAGLQLSQLPERFWNLEAQAIQLISVLLPPSVLTLSHGSQRGPLDYLMISPFTLFFEA